MVACEVLNAISSDCYKVEVDYLKKKVECNMLLIGAPCMGKSALVNALTGGKQSLTETSISSQAGREALRRYQVNCKSLKGISNAEKSTVFVWETNAIESWEKESGASSMFQFVDRIQPICVIYCVSSGCFANLAQVQRILDYCQNKNIVCATILTNMWSGKYILLLDPFID
jgi:GTPase SAR1 family protein